MRAEADIEFVPNEKGDAYEPPRSAAKIATKLPLLNLISGFPCGAPLLSYRHLTGH